MRRITALTLSVVVSVAAAATLADLPPTAAIGALQDSLNDVVDRPGWQDDQWSVLAVSLERGDTLYSVNPGQALAPASSLKLMTTAAALRHLGPEYRYNTYMVTDGQIENGVLVGNVYLYGTGDPTLGKRFAPRATPVWYAFADSLAALGVTEIRGDVVGDGSYFQGSSTGEGWKPSYLNAWYAPAAGALSVHENLVRIDVTPGAPGGPPKLEFTPGGDGIAIDMQATTGGGRGLQVLRLDYNGPIVVTGNISGGKVSRAVPVSDPAQYAAALFRDVLVEKGITVGGGVRSITDPAQSPFTGHTAYAPAYEKAKSPRVLAIHRSEPLREILTVINHVSHNFYAEQVARTVGRAAYGDGSLRGNERAIEHLLAEAGVDTAQTQIKDGCGLSPLNRVSAHAFVAMLDMIAKSPYAQEFESTMTVAGETRRFRRMGGTAAAGNLRAKTGTIDNVSALAGYVTAADGEKVAFSIISNNVPSVAQAKYIENVIGVHLAGFSRGGALPADSAAPATQPAATATPAARR